MKFTKYLKDIWVVVLIFIIFFITMLSFFIAFKITKELILAFIITYIIFSITILLYSYYRKKYFYQTFLNNLNKLDQKYLITELMKKPNFYEGKIIYDAIYEIDKSMAENVNNYKRHTEDFKEYIELWIHEVKLPLASLNLITHNNKTNQKIKKCLEELDNYIEQILYYVRSENPEKDYLIKKHYLEDIVKNVALKNKDNFLYTKTDFIVSDLDKEVLTDSKWLEYIINQIISNSLKYLKEENPYIKITAYENDKEINLIILDNGKGISQSDLPRVFDKSFTGENGHEKGKATGMGLYICYNLCEKLGHKLKIESVKDKFTKVTITFMKNDYYLTKM